MLFPLRIHVTIIITNVIVSVRAVFERCFVNVTEAIKISEIALKELSESQLTAQVTELVQFQQVESMHIVISY